MQIKDYISMMTSVLDAFKHSIIEEDTLAKGKPLDQDTMDWNHAFSEFVRERGDSFCPTCTGEGFIESTGELATLRPSRCPDCAGDLDEYYDFKSLPRE